MLFSEARHRNRQKISGVRRWFNIGIWWYLWTVYNQARYRYPVLTCFDAMAGTQRVCWLLDSDLQLSVDARTRCTKGAAVVLQAADVFYDLQAPQTVESVHERLRIMRYWAEEESLCPHQLQSDEVSKRECTKRVWCNDLSVFLVWFFPKQAYLYVPHSSPTLGSFGRMGLHLSPPCLPLCVPWAAWVYTFSNTCLSLWVPWAAWVYTCLPLVSHSGCLGPHEFTLVSPLSPTLGALGRMSLHLSPPLSPTLGALGRMNLNLSPPCLPLWVPWAAWVYTCLPLVSRTCLPHLSLTLLSHTCFPHLFPTLVSHTCFPLWVSWSAWFYTCLPLVSHTCFPHLSPTLGSLGRMSLHLSPPCLPLWVPWATWVYTCLPLVSHSGCLGPHEFTLVSHMFPTLVSHTCLPHLSPTLVSHTCLPLWVP